MSFADRSAALVIPPEVTAITMQQSQPTLFLAILNAASVLFPAAVQMNINRKLLETFARLILIVGSKSLELVQALQVGTVWYYAPPKYKDLKYYQYIHCASVMAIDLGMNRNSSRRLEPKVGLAECRSSQSGNPRPVLSTSTQARRAWLVCYFTSAQTAQNLRRENLIRWTPYLADCLQILSSSPDAADPDKVLCRWIKLQHIADDISNQFLIEHPSSSRTLDDTSLQFTMRSFEQQLDDCISSSRLQNSVVLRMTESFVKVYLHEVALHAGSLDDDMQPPFTEEALGKMKPMREISLSAAYIKSLSDCLTNVYAFLDAFLGIPFEEIQCQPVFVFVRLTYVLVVLVRTNTSASSYHVDLGGGFLRAAREKVYEYAEAVIARLREASQENRCPSAAKFCLVIISLRKCFARLSSERRNPSESLSTTESTLLARGSSLLSFERNDYNHHPLAPNGLGHVSIPQSSGEACQQFFTAPVTPDLKFNSGRDHDNGETQIWPWPSAGIESDKRDPGSVFRQFGIEPQEALFDDEMLRMLTQADAPMYTTGW